MNGERTLDLGLEEGAQPGLPAGLSLPFTSHTGKGHSALASDTGWDSMKELIGGFEATLPLTLSK